MQYKANKLPISNNQITTSLHQAGNKLLNLDVLKITAIISMLIDHIGFYNYPEIRFFGRIAVLIFLMLLALNTMKKFYIERVLLFAILAQVPYTLYFQTPQLNILFTFAFIQLFMQTRNPVFLILLIFCDYGIFAFAVYYSFRKFFETDNPLYLHLTFILSFIMITYYFNPIFALNSFIVYLALLYKNFEYKRLLNKYFFYYFYIFHIIALMLLF